MLYKLKRKKAVIIAFINGKGGCGKTTSIFQTAGVLSYEGYKVLVIDLDKQKNSTTLFLLENEEYNSNSSKCETIYDYFAGRANLNSIRYKANLQKPRNKEKKCGDIDILVGDRRFTDWDSLIHLHEKGVNIETDLKGWIEGEKYDFVLVDMPPSNPFVDKICFQQIADYVLTPLSSDLFSLDGYNDLMVDIEDARKLNPTLQILGVYMAKSDGRQDLDNFIHENVKENFRDVFLGEIPFKAEIAKSTANGRPLSYLTRSINPRTEYVQGRVAYENLVKRMIKQINKLQAN